ncbi:hypothetical protein BJF81_03280 [Ornithinimicrobium sp. CNJ-824]|nr:hypothetical protein BJF81_03280 [Ornithinimicrobium sp. CNJ-824]
MFILDSLGKDFHVAVAGPRANRVDPQPPRTGCFVFFFLFFVALIGAEVLVHRLGPDLPRGQVDSPASVGGVALAHAGELLQIDTDRPQEWLGAITEPRRKCVGQIDVAVPSPRLQSCDAGSSQVMGAGGSRGDRDQESVTDELQHLLRPGSLLKKAQHLKRVGAVRGSA